MFLDVVSVTRAVDEGVVTLVGLYINVGGRNGDTTHTLFRGVVNLVQTPCIRPDPCQQALGDRCGQCRLTKFNVTNRSDVLLRFITLKFSLGHRLFLCLYIGCLIFVCVRIRSQHLHDFT